MGVLERRQAGGGATFKRKNINKEFEFQSSSKMMSVSQKKKTSFHHYKPVKKQPKRKRELLVFVSMSFQKLCPL